MFSQMTIINEVMNYEKYDYLRYIEFIEMICRVSLKLDPSEGNAAYKVYGTLKNLRKKMADQYIDPFVDLEIEEVRLETLNKTSKLDIAFKGKD